MASHGSIKRARLVNQGVPCRVLHAQLFMMQPSCVSTCKNDEYLSASGSGLKRLLWTDRHTLQELAKAFCATTYRARYVGFGQPHYACQAPSLKEAVVLGSL